MLVASCDHDANTYAWDDRRVLCSEGVDDLEYGLPWSSLEDQLALAAKDQRVVILHAHVPGVTVSPAAIERLFATAQNDGLELVTFRDLAPENRPRGGLALAFDDNAPDQWFELRDLFARYHAHVTFFVSRYTQITPLGHEELAMLAAQGHDLEPHTVNHLDGPAYVAAHGIDAYLADEVLPSIQVLLDAGYPPATTLAYPFGSRSDEIDTAVLAHIAKVRTTLGPCPW